MRRLFFTEKTPPAQAATPGTAAPTAELSLDLDDLVRFWRDPARAWVRAQGITLSREEPDDEVLDVAGAQYQWQYQQPHCAQRLLHG